MAKQTFTTGQVLTAAQMTSLQQTAMGGGSTTAKVASYVLVAGDAGTVVQMNAAGATTITVNTALFAAGDTVQIQNVGAGVCTVTAGTATVNTSSTLALKQFDAGSLYFNSASAAIFFATDAADSTSPLTTKGDLYTFSTLDARLPVGTNNQTLVADSTASTGLKWAAPSSAAFSGCRLEIGSTYAISNATLTTLTFNTETYDTDSYHDNTTNNSRITIPTGKSGYFLITTFTMWFWNVTGFRQLQITKNGTAVWAAELGTTGASQVGTSANHAVQTVLNLTAGDFIELKVKQDTGANLSMGGNDIGPNNVKQTFFSAVYLGA